ncbi:hypothetical protein F5878DRAFT_504290, partial [Lentinula raphanica]
PLAFTSHHILSTFHLWHDPDDIDLMGVIISHLEHADDMVLLSRTSHGIQHHLDTFSAYCYSSSLAVSAGKSWFMVFGRMPDPLPALFLAGTALSCLDISRYVGVHFQSSG